MGTSHLTVVSLFGEDTIFGMVHLPPNDNSLLCLVIAKTDLSLSSCFSNWRRLTCSQVPQGSLYSYAAVMRFGKAFLRKSDHFPETVLRGWERLFKAIFLPVFDWHAPVISGGGEILNSEQALEPGAQCKSVPVPLRNHTLHRSSILGQQLQNEIPMRCWSAGSYYITKLRKGHPGQRLRFPRN